MLNSTFFFFFKPGRCRIVVDGVSLNTSLLAPCVMCKFHSVFPRFFLVYFSHDPFHVNYKIATSKEAQLDKYL